MALIVGGLPTIGGASHGPALDAGASRSPTPADLEDNPGYPTAPYACFHCRQPIAPDDAAAQCHLCLGALHNDCYEWCGVSTGRLGKVFRATARNQVEGAACLVADIPRDSPDSASFSESNSSKLCKVTGFF